VGISDFDPSDYSKQPSFSQLQLNIKRIFRNLDADMPIHEYISVLCKVILERDPSSIVKLIKQIIPDIPNQRNLEHLHRLLNMLMDAH
jgi:hypothetical protein